MDFRLVNDKVVAKSNFCSSPLGTTTWTEAIYYIRADLRLLNTRSLAISIVAKPNVDCTKIFTLNTFFISIFISSIDRLHKHLPKLGYPLAVDFPFLLLQVVASTLIFGIRTPKSNLTLRKLSWISGSKWKSQFQKRLVRM